MDNVKLCQLACYLDELSFSQRQLFVEEVDMAVELIDHSLVALVGS